MEKFSIKTEQKILNIMETYKEDLCNNHFGLFDPYPDFPMVGKPMTLNDIYFPMICPWFSQISFINPLVDLPMYDNRTNKPIYDHFIDIYRDIKKDNKNDEFDELLNDRLNSDDANESDDEVNACE